MQINTYNATNYPTNRNYYGKVTNSATATKSFSENMENVPNSGVANTKGYTVKLMTPDTVYSGGNGSGLSFDIKYAEGSTKDNPIMIAQGVDENGNAFEQLIHINEIDPQNANLVEMRALEGHLNGGKPVGLENEMRSGNLGLTQKTDYIALLKDSIDLYGGSPSLSSQHYAMGLSQKLDDFLEFMDKK